MPDEVTQVNIVGPAAPAPPPAPTDAQLILALQVRNAALEAIIVALGGVIPQ